VPLPLCCFAYSCFTRSFPESSYWTEPSLGLVWYESICGDGRVLSRPIPESPIFPDRPFGTRVLGRNHPRPSPPIPFPGPVLAWAQSSTTTSRIIPIPVQTLPSAARKRPANKRAAASGAAEREAKRRRGERIGGEGRELRGVEHLTGRDKDGSRRTSSHRRRHRHHRWNLTGDDPSRLSCTPIWVTHYSHVYFHVFVASLAV
jgi:hypothetical protein